MKAYKITLPCGRAFTCVTDEPEQGLPAAIFERFRVYPVEVQKL